MTDRADDGMRTCAWTIRGELYPRDHETLPDETAAVAIVREALGSPDADVSIESISHPQGLVDVPSYSDVDVTSYSDDVPRFTVSGRVSIEFAATLYRDEEPTR